MKQKISFFLLAALSLSMLAMAAEPPVEPAQEITHLRIHRTDGRVVNAPLDEDLVLDFLYENRAEYLALKAQGAADTKIALDDIRKMTFGTALVPEDPEPQEPDPNEPEPEMPVVLPNRMYVHYTNGVVETASLDEQVVLRFLSDNMQISILRAPTIVSIDEVRKITFGSEEPDGPTTDAASPAEDRSASDSPAVRKVVENGQVVIIKDGVKYNLLGRRVQ